MISIISIIKPKNGSALAILHSNNMSHSSFYKICIYNSTLNKVYYMYSQIYYLFLYIPCPTKFYRNTSNPTSFFLLINCLKSWYIKALTTNLIYSPIRSVLFNLSRYCISIRCHAIWWYIYWNFFQKWTYNMYHKTEILLDQEEYKIQSFDGKNTKFNQGVTSQRKLRPKLGGIGIKLSYFIGCGCSTIYIKTPHCYVLILCLSSSVSSFSYKKKKCFIILASSRKHI